MCFENMTFFKTETLLKGAEKGNIDEVTSCLKNGVDIESKNNVRLTDSFDLHTNMMDL
jgi:hypothetical protein